MHDTATQAPEAIIRDLLNRDIAERTVLVDTYQRRARASFGDAADDWRRLAHQENLVVIALCHHRAAIKSALAERIAA